MDGWTERQTGGRKWKGNRWTGEKMESEWETETKKSKEKETMELGRQGGREGREKKTN